MLVPGASEVVEPTPSASPSTPVNDLRWDSALPFGFVQVKDFIYRIVKLLIVVVRGSRRSRGTQDPVGSTHVSGGGISIRSLRVAFLALVCFLLWKLSHQERNLPSSS